MTLKSHQSTAGSRTRLDVQHTPTHWDDEMRSVTISLSLANPEPGHGFIVSKELSVSEAREFIARIERSIAIVESDRAASDWPDDATIR